MSSPFESFLENQINKYFKILDKSEVLRKMAYLRHIVTPEGVKPNLDETVAIKIYPIPKITKEIKEFLRLLGYYRKCIKDRAG